MSNIDLSQLVTPEDKAAMARAARREAAKQECRRRIVAVCDETAQINLAAAVAAGHLSDGDLATYRSVLEWVRSMRMAWPVLADAKTDLSGDANWPALPDGAMDLVARY